MAEGRPVPALSLICSAIPRRVKSLSGLSLYLLTMDHNNSSPSWGCCRDSDNAQKGACCPRFRLGVLSLSYFRGVKVLTHPPEGGRMRSAAPQLRPR